MDLCDGLLDCTVDFIYGEVRLLYNLTLCDVGLFSPEMKQLIARVGEVA